MDGQGRKPFAAEPWRACPGAKGKSPESKLYKKEIFQERKNLIDLYLYGVQRRFTNCSFGSRLFSFSNENYTE
jgi:hypothetical protein